MRSKRFETQEVREIGRKKVGESKGFLILWMGILEDVFHMKGKDQMQRLEKIEIQRGTRKKMRPLGTRSLAELGKVAFGWEIEKWDFR